YGVFLENALRFLDGDIDPVLSGLNKAMKKYADEQNYEKAARIRDIIFDINKISERQKVSINITRDQDYLNVGILGREALLVLFEFRKGVLLGRKINVFDNADLSEPREIIRSFIIDYYQYADVPGKIISAYSIEDKNTIEKFLTQRASKKVVISQPATPEDRGILNMIKKNIDMIAADREAAKYYHNMEEGMKILQKVLSLKRLPKEIVCFDISNLQGTNSVASMVTFRNGAPDKSSYKRFKIRGYEGANDPAMIHEAVARQLQYLVNENIPLPDLMVIDGGPTQLARAMEAAANFQIDLKIISLAKRLEEIYFSPKEKPILLEENSSALKLLQNIRDESHRFAVTYHRALRAKELTHSELDEIPGVSVKTRKLLLAHFDSIDAIKKTGVSELKEIGGIGQKTARAIYSFFHENAGAESVKG
ncbi:MAG: excinuclease ABC subunit UvrC, partial [Spirochaetia bacterium]|nr:excinuclease ABC subunit UvrC [Spirochaetia bacterium]